jgi:outer membrane receptor protein involved in Fe transport
MLSPRLRRVDSADRSFHSVTLFGLILLLAAPLAGADEPDPAHDDEAPATHALGRVTVTATRAERDVLEVPGNVTVIEREEIERSGVRTVPELLKRQSGLYLTSATTNPAGVQVEARGFNNAGALGSSLLVQVNGRRINEADTANTDWTLIELDEIESIEIVRGPASALYGDNAVGGVINIRTRPVEGPPRATVRGRVGRYDTGGGSLKAAGSFGAVTGSLFVDGLVTDGYRRGADFERVDVKGSLQTELRDRVILGASGGWYSDERGFPGHLTQEQLETLGRRAQNPDSAGTGSEVENRFVDGWLDAVLAQDVLLRIQPYYRWRDDESRNVFASGAGFNTDIRDKSSLGVNALIQVDRTLAGLSNRLIVGFDFLRDDTDRTDAYGGLFDSLQVSDNEKIVYAGFLQEELNLLETLILSAGVRFDRAEYDLSVVDLLIPSEPATDDPAFSIWSPKAALTWHFLPAASAYFSYSRGFRLPNFDENAPTLTGGFPTIPDLDRQLSDSFELGGKWRSERVDASLALYWMNVKDEIILNPLLNCFPGFGCFGQNDNFDRVRHRGIELAAAVQLVKWLTVYANYTFEDVVVTDEDEASLEGARMPITPKHRGNLGFVARFAYDIELTLHALFADERIVGNDFDRQAPTLKPYATVDLQLAWRPTFGEHVQGALTLALRNVNAEEYDGLAVRSISDPTVVGFYPAAKRTWEVGFMLTLRR